MGKAVSVIIDEFIAAQDVNELSAREYRSVIAHFVRWIVYNKLDFWLLRRADILRYKADMIAARLSTYTISLYLTLVRKLFNYLEMEGLRDDNIAAGIRAPKKDNTFKKLYLSVDQVRMLLESIDKSKINGLRDYAIISLMVRTGVRRVEVCRMRVCDIADGGGAIAVQRKGRVDKSNKIALPSKAMDAINNYLVARGEVDDVSPLFVGMGDGPLTDYSISRMIKRRLSAVGVIGKAYTCHSLRHTSAVLALKAGASIYDVQQMLGHTSIETTRIYLRSLDAEKRLDNAAIRCLNDLF